MPEKKQLVPVIVNGEGYYAGDDVQPSRFMSTREVIVPPGCFQMMVTPEDFEQLKKIQVRITRGGNLKTDLS